ncbi:MAG: DUF2442 domain-containing protein [Pseudomonadota bacterium]|nr:DUF2442 domain-containing protein [Pseudomonadota bacterium]
MNHKIFRVRSFRLVAPYTLAVTFDDGLEQVIDFSPILAGELFGPLRDEQLFNQVRLDPEAHTLVWPNGADFDPETLHDWPQMLPLLIQQVQRWKLAA